MKINVESIHFKADKELVDFAESKISKLVEKNDSIISIDMSLIFNKSEKIDNKTSELSMKVAKTVLFAKKSSSSFEESIDLVLEAMRRQLKKYKEKKQ